MNITSSQSGLRERNEFQPAKKWQWKEPNMMDIIFIVATVLFFTLAIFYVRGCELLGKGRPHERS